MSATPEFFYSIVFANFQEKNFEHDLDTDRLLATPVIGLETARCLKKWRKLVASSRQRLANARAAYAATRSAEAANKFAQVSIEVVSTPSCLYDCLEIAKARDQTTAKRAELRRMYREQLIKAYGVYCDAFYKATNEQEKETAHKAYLAEEEELLDRWRSDKVLAFVCSKSLM